MCCGGGVGRTKNRGVVPQVPVEHNTGVYSFQPAKNQKNKRTERPEQQRLKHREGGKKEDGVRFVVCSVFLIFIYPFLLRPSEGCVTWTFLIPLVPLSYKRDAFLMKKHTITFV